MMRKLTANEYNKMGMNLLKVDKLLVQDAMPSRFVFGHELCTIHEHVGQDPGPQKRAKGSLEVTLVLVYSSLLRLGARSLDERHGGYTLGSFADVLFCPFFEFCDGEIVIGTIVHFWRWFIVVSGVVGKVKVSLFRSEALSRKRRVKNGNSRHENENRTHKENQRDRPDCEEEEDKDYVTRSSAECHAPCDLL